MTTEDKPETPLPYSEALSLEALRALAHPLRVRIMNELSDFGSMTASGLAERLGESSGATSYHLRQLAKHGIIVELEGKGSARERWWNMAPGGITIGSVETLKTPAGREATELISREWQQNNERRLTAFLRYGLDVLGPEWSEASTLSTTHLQLTMEQLAEIGQEYYSMVTQLKAKWQAAGYVVSSDDIVDENDDRRRVQVQFNAFPLVEGAA
ncbi:ArsR/SmtB family transcription factor [Leifsonia poae]|uniref:ArsR/SmtB family transcription factor n=1 Tax=Leifsonia poae TaxID=110933 RepID=UPI001CBD31A6|nr:helix-turn-helix domain-containing protein [Leifsonia poae]